MKHFAVHVEKKLGIGVLHLNIIFKAYLLFMLGQVLDFSDLTYFTLVTWG